MLLAGKTDKAEGIESKVCTARHAPLRLLCWLRPRLPATPPPPPTFPTIARTSAA